MQSVNSPAVPAPLISMRNISIAFGGTAALDAVDFEVLPGEVHCLAGENGSGKSTLIKIVTGVYNPLEGGSVQFDGVDYPAMTPALAQRLGIGVIWQDLALFPEMSVGENISIQSIVGQRLKRVDYGKMRALATRALSRLGVELDIDRPLREYPIAQRQIVAIARALVGAAKLIFMDEPTASLTQSETNTLLAIVRKLSADGVAIVFVSHRLAEVLEISSRITVLRDGKLVGVYPASSMTQSHISELMTGRLIEHKPREKIGSDRQTILEVSGLTRRSEFEDVTFSLKRGETLGLTGLLGAGRTELALSLFGMSRPDGGSITLEGEQLHLRSNRDAIKAGIAYLSEDRLSIGLVQPQSIADNLVVASLDKISTWVFTSDQRKLEVVRRWVNDLDVRCGPLANPISTLSGGNQQKIAIAKWLATSPRVLILDAPTVGVDVGARAGLFEIVDRLAQQGLSIILISDEVSEIYLHSDRVLHMANGRIVGTYVTNECSLEELEANVYA
jgi:simple sugar transport system ATP-binding protein